MGTFTAAACDFYERLTTLWNDQRAFSERAFKPDAERGPVGALRHLSKEATEAADQLIADGHKPGARGSDAALVEFADCFLLLLDATRRAGFKLVHVIDAAAEKLKVNEARHWPAPGDDDTPVEHVRGEVQIPDVQLPDVGASVAEGVRLSARAALEHALKRCRTGAIITIPEAAERYMTPEMLAACLGPDLFAQLNQVDVLDIATCASQDPAETAEWLPYYKAALTAQTNVSAEAMHFAVALADYKNRADAGDSADELADDRTDLAGFVESICVMLRASCMLCGLGPNVNDTAARHRCEAEAGKAVASTTERLKCAMPRA